MKETIPGAVLGILMIIFGLNKFFGFIAVDPPADPVAQAFLGSMFTSYLFKVVALAEIIRGLLLLVPKLRFLGWLLLALVVFNIVAFHVGHDFIGNGIWLLPTALFVWVGTHFRAPLSQLLKTAKVMDKRIWFITGISSGLGKSMANAAMAAGYFVIGTFRQPKQVTVFNNENEGQGKGVLLDINDLNAGEKIIQEVYETYGRIDVLVNNAGLGFVGAIEETSIEEVRRVFETNFFGTLALTQAVLPLMRTQRSEHIVQISSHGGVKAFGGFGIYNVSKFALEGFSEALAQEVAPLGIYVSIVEPGPFRTAFAGNNLGLASGDIAAYQETAGAFKTKLHGVNGKQEGDPDKAAQSYQLGIANIEVAPGKHTDGDDWCQDRKYLEANREVAERVVF